MTNPMLLFASATLLGSLIALTISGVIGILLGFFGGLTGTILIDSASGFKRNLKTDVERVIESLLKPEDWMHLYIKILAVLLLSPLTGLCFYMVLPNGYPMPEVIAVNVAFITFALGGRYIKDNFL